MLAPPPVQAKESGPEVIAAYVADGPRGDAIQTARRRGGS